MQKANRVRKRLKVDNVVTVPNEIKSVQEIPAIFSDLKMFLKSSNNCAVDEDSIELIARVHLIESSYESFFEIGSVLKLRVTESGFCLGYGWFSATIQNSDIQMDEITVAFLAKPDKVMTIEVAQFYSKDNIKLL